MRFLKFHVRTLADDTGNYTSKIITGRCLRKVYQQRL